MKIKMIVKKGPGDYFDRRETVSASHRKAEKKLLHPIIRVIQQN